MGSELYAFDPCKKVAAVDHMPRADVAHNPSAVNTISDPFILPVTIDMADRYNLDLPDGTLLESNLGFMEIYKDGRIIYNGEDISGNIEDRCDNDTGEFESIIERESENGDNPDTGRELP
jgi:hypothetical protein